MTFFKKVRKGTEKSDSKKMSIYRTIIQIKGYIWAIVHHKDQQYED